MPGKGFDRDVPREQALACALWKCYQNARDDGTVGDGSVTWWTIQPYERAHWRDVADRFKDAYTVNPVFKEFLEE